MHSSLIGKIEKARRYAQERDRVKFQRFTVHFRGENSDHLVSYQDGRWTCECGFFAGHGTCSHTMALQKMLADMLPREAVTSESAGASALQPAL